MYPLWTLQGEKCHKWPLLDQLLFGPRTLSMADFPSQPQNQLDFFLCFGKRGHLCPCPHLLPRTFRVCKPVPMRVYLSAVQLRHARKSQAHGGRAEETETKSPEACADS